MTETEDEIADTTPAEVEWQPPAKVNTTRRYGGHLCLAASGPETCNVIFVSTSAYEEEVEETRQMAYGRSFSIKPEFMRGVEGQMFKDVAASVGIPAQVYRYTALIKELLPPDKRNRPSASISNKWIPALLHDIDACGAQLVVCFGKPVFDALAGVKLKFGEIAGGIFPLKDRPGVSLLATHELHKVVRKPEYIDALRTDLKEVLLWLRDQSSGISVRRETDYRYIRDLESVEKLVNELEGEKKNLISVDCEWGGRTFADGSLRSIQLSWEAGRAACVTFLNERREYVMQGASMPGVGRCLARHLNNPEVKYVGHHIAADFPWMHHFLGLEWYEKCLLDTEFAGQVSDEYLDLKLERLAVKWSDLGRYDAELTLWKKLNPQDESDGYAYIPDRIIEPYSCRDVDCVMRVYPKILKSLAEQDLLDYYFNVHHPFVTDVFTHFAIQGLPVDVALMDDVRDVYQRSREILEQLFRTRLAKSSKAELLMKMMECKPEASPLELRKVVQGLEVLWHEEKPMEALAAVRDVVGAGNMVTVQPCLDHFWRAPGFNIRSVDHMRTWLFDVKGHTPVKSTNNKEKGLPSRPWEKVLDLSPERQKEFKPSVDKQSLQIFGQTDEEVKVLLDLNAVGNICKAFLKEPVEDDDGNVTKEQGLHFWLGPSLTPGIEKKIRNQYSTTETGRPRAWQPNVLNIPKWTNKEISRGILTAIKWQKEQGNLHPSLLRFENEPVPSLRSLISFEPTWRTDDPWCITESDYKTAEVRGLAFMSADANLIRILIMPDEDFGLVRQGKDEVPVRLRFMPETGIANHDGQHDDCLMAIWNKEKFVRKVSESELLRNADGSLKHPGADLHWSLIEMSQGDPREKLNKDKDRNSGKVGNFSSAYGAQANAIERKIESDTGFKPEPGTGQRILDALAKRQPDATAFLLDMETCVVDPGYYVSPSGRRRRFATHPEFMAVDAWVRRSAISNMAREARNFPMQNNVGDTAARAAAWSLKFTRTYGLRGSPKSVLYDSVCAASPLQERWLWKSANEVFMHLANGWLVKNDVVLRYPIDTEFVVRWSWPATPEQAEILNDPEKYPEPTSENFRAAREYLERAKIVYADERKALSVRTACELPRV